MYGPAIGGNLLKLENLLKSFTLQVSGIKHLNYWDRLEAVGLSSIGRRIERYSVIYVHKVITGRVNDCGLNYHNNDRSGVMIDIIPTKKYYTSLCENSFHYIASRL